MTTELIIAEKPSVASDMAAALGGFKREQGYFSRPGTLIAAARGHLVEIGMQKQVDPGFDLAKLPVIPAPFHLFPIKGCEQSLMLLGELSGRPDVSKIVNACDAGREGELIFRLIVAFLGVRKPMDRMWLQSMTAAGIKTAFAQRRTDTQMKPLADAALCRAEADWLIGINATRALTKSNMVTPGQLVAAGRVQSPVLTMVVDREAEINAFVSRAFWEVIVTLTVPAGTWLAKLQVKPAAEGEEPDRFYTKADASKVALQCEGKRPTSTKDTTAPFSRGAPLPFDLTTLQRTANTKLGLSASKTLDIAQALYEKHKVTTYPRTSSSHLPEDYPAKVSAVMGTLPARYQALCTTVISKGWVTNKHPVFNDKKISDHFAIIPTGKVPEGLDDKEQQVYDMIVRRFIAAFYPAAEYSKTTRITVIEGHCFRAIGTVLLSPGWLRVYEAAGGAEDADDTGDSGKGGKGGKDDSVVLPKLADGDTVVNEKVAVTQGKTKPPSRYTEATLLRAMETAGKLVDDEAMSDAMRERGLGTESTRAPTIEKLLNDRDGYMVRKGKQLAPTPKAIELIGALRRCGIDSLTSPALTGEWEWRLAQMEKGQFKRAEFMLGVKEATAILVDKVKANATGARNE